MIGKGNEDVININNVPVKALLDTGSEISTITEECLDQLDPRPKIRSMDDFGLDIKAAGGHSIPYKGYVFVAVSAPFNNGVSQSIPILVVSLTEYNETVPVIVGTNILERLHEVKTDKSQIPDSWNTAFKALISPQVGVVKTKNRVVLQTL